MKNLKNIALIILGLLATIFFFGWVLPDFAYTRRLSKQEADLLYNELRQLWFIHWRWVEDRSYPKLTPAESKRLKEISLKLIKAGYDAQIAKDVSALRYPEYAQTPINT